MKLHDIFPLAVAEFRIPIGIKSLREDLKMYKNIMKEHPLLDGGGFSTYDPSVSLLDKTEFRSLKKTFDTCLKEYQELIGLKDLQIVNSWFSVMTRNSSLKQHRHPASIVSGAYYPKCSINSVGLTFKNPLEPYRMCELYNGITEFNAVKGTLSVQEGHLFIFPSWLEHGTDVHTQEEERYVISFNTMHVNQSGHNKKWSAPEYHTKTI